MQLQLYTVYVPTSDVYTKALNKLVIVKAAVISVQSDITGWNNHSPALLRNCHTGVNPSSIIELPRKSSCGWRNATSKCPVFVYRF